MVNTFEIISLWAILQDFGIDQLHHVNLFHDNQAVLRVGSIPNHHDQINHVETDYHFIREQVQEGMVKLGHASTINHRTDVFTKQLSCSQFSMGILSWLGKKG